MRFRDTRCAEMMKASSWRRYKLANAALPYLLRRAYGSVSHASVHFIDRSER